MESFLLSVALLSGAAFIHRRSVAPELRLPNRAADRVWRLLGRAAFLAWLAMLAWGGLYLGVWQALAALPVSLAVNMAIAQLGPLRAWPGLSMLLAVTGLGVAAAMVLGQA